MEVFCDTRNLMKLWPVHLTCTSGHAMSSTSGKSMSLQGGSDKWLGTTLHSVPGYLTACCFFGVGLVVQQHCLSLHAQHTFIVQPRHVKTLAWTSLLHSYALC